MEEKEINLQNVSRENIQIIGAELKRRRINQSKTLVNLSSVCSVSYISKIENGKIIPKLNVLRELCEEQGISKDELNTLLTVDDLIDKCIEALFWENREKISDVYNKVYLFDNYKVTLIKTMYEMTYFHWDIVNHLLSSLYIIKDNLEERDFYLYTCLLMRYENATFNYPGVFERYSDMNFCKNDFLMAIASKELFIAVAKYGLENPSLAYQEYNKRYSALFNYSNELMYDLLVETLVRANYRIPETLKKSLKPPMKLEYCLISNDFNELDNLLLKYNPTQFEKLLITTAKKDYSMGEKIYKKLQLNKLCARDFLIASYCNLINKGLDEELATFIIQVAAPAALKENDGLLFKMFLNKLSNISFSVGKYKAVVTMNLTFFKMLEKCGKCLL